LSALERENERLRQENECLRQQREEDLAHISRLRRAEEQAQQSSSLVKTRLRTSEEQLLRTLEAARTVMWEGRLADDSLMEVGPVAALFGQPEGAMGNDRSAFINRIHPEDRERVLTAVQSGADGDDAYDVEYRVLLPDGEVRWIQATGRFDRDADGRQVRLRGIARDVTERRQAEDQIRESLSLLEATLNATADGLLVVDQAGRIKSFNRQFQHIWNIPDAVLDGHSVEEAAAIAVTQVKDPEAFLAMRRHSTAHPEIETFDVLELKDGRILERISRPQVMGDRVVGHVVSLRDVTERHRAQRRQAELLARLARTNDELTHFAYVVSHDLKAPLRGITLITEWLCADYGDKLGDDAKEQLALLQSRVARMHNLIDGVLQYSRVGRIREEITQVDLNELIAGIIDGIAPPAHVHIIVEGRLPTVEGERTRLTQAFQNLLVNAVEFMDKPLGEIRVGCVEEAGLWRFHVADNGPGIEEKYFDRIFRLFQTLAPRDEFESIGVGLALVKKIVETYGGRIWVESVVGRGSTFLFTLPKRSEEADDAVAPMCQKKTEHKGGAV